MDFIRLIQTIQVSQSIQMVQMIQVNQSRWVNESIEAIQVFQAGHRLAAIWALVFESKSFRIESFNAEHLFITAPIVIRSCQMKVAN